MEHAARNLDSKAYAYQTLSTNNMEVRLIDVHPAKEDYLPLQCSIRHVRLASDPKPEYETISYVWGSPNTRAFIKLDGSKFGFPASSIAAIRRMRLPDRIRTLWIDSMCINQADLDERAQQVALMADVYRNSKGNLIYLGEGDDKATDLALKDLNAILKEMYEETNGLTLVDNTSFDPTITRTKLSYAENGLQCRVDCSRLIDCIFSLPWFSRLWVYQEAALAPINTCFRGQFQFSLLDAVRVARWLYHKQNYISTEVLNHPGLHLADSLFDFVDKKYGLYESRPANFSALLDLARALDVTERRDRIYGMLGLKQWPTGIPSLLSPDYRKPVAVVFRDSTRYALQYDDHPSLQEWRHVSWQSSQELEREGICSWVPDRESGWDPKKPPKSLARVFNCAKGSRQSRQKLLDVSQSDPDVFVILGFELCRVANVTPSLTLKDSNNAHLLRAWTDCALSVMQQSNDSEFAALVFLAGVNNERQPANRHDTSAWRDFRRLIYEEQRLPRTPESSIQGDEVGTLTREADRDAYRYYRAFGAGCVQRSVFRTVSGYIGLGPQITRAGDIVAVFHGGSWPFILRPSGDDYRLLGASYVHGIMFGKAMRRHRKSKTPDTIFRIR